MYIKVNLQIQFYLKIMLQNKFNKKKTKKKQTKTLWRDDFYFVESHRYERWVGGLISFLIDLLKTHF